MDQKNHNIIEFKKLLISHKILNQKGLVVNYETKLIKYDLSSTLYNITKFLDHFDSSIRERLIYIFLEKTEPILCKECNKNKIKIHTNRFSTYCSTRCSSLNKNVQFKLKKTNQTRYGVDCVFQNIEIKQKSKNTILKKYGANNPQQNEEIKQKTKATNLSRHGVEYPSQSKLIKEKTKQTKLDRYDDVKYNNFNKAKQTKLDRYGNEYYNNSEKTKQTNLIRYGTKICTQNNQIKSKISSTKVNNDIEKYSYVLELIDNKEWLILQHHIMKKTLTQISSELCIQYSSTLYNYFKKHRIKIYKFNNSYTSIQWLVHIMHTENIYIQHAQNEGEYRIPNTRYYADGYCTETNTIYEFHGDFWHGNPKLYNPNDKPFPNYERTFGQLYEATVQKENIIKELGYNLIVKWETDD